MRNATQRRSILAVPMLLTLTVLAGCSNGENDPSGEDTLEIGWAASPASIVPSENTAMATRDIGFNMYEGLVTYDGDREIAPMLAESWEVSDDGTSVTFTLREGVPFHDGTEMSPEDVVASIDFWRARNGPALEHLESLDMSVDGNAVTLSTDEPRPILDFVAMTTHPLVIMPASVIEGVAEGEGVTDYVGTGPYEYVEWVEDQHVLLTRFDDYVGVEDDPSGYAGSKAASIENLRFVIAPDSSARVSGLESGTYHAIDQVQPDDVMQLDTPEYETTTHTGTFSSLFFNHAEGLMTDENLRRAIYAGIDIEQVELATFADESQWDMDGAWVVEGSDFYTEEGLGNWNAGDLDLAQEFVEASSYDGETVRLLATQDYPQVYNFAIVVQETLTDLGIDSEITTQPWTTMLETRTDAGAWDITFSTLWPLPTVPSAHSFLAPSYPGWIDYEDITEALEQVHAAQTPEERQEASEALQRANADRAGWLKSGNQATIHTSTTDVAEIDYLDGPIYWNAEFTE